MKELPIVRNYSRWINPTWKLDCGGPFRVRTIPNSMPLNKTPNEPVTECSESEYE
jgi:hypothetical protein